MHTVMLRLAVKVAQKFDYFVARDSRYTEERKNRLRDAATAYLSRVCRRTDKRLKPALRSICCISEPIESITHTKKQTKYHAAVVAKFMSKKQESTRRWVQKQRQKYRK